MAGRRAGVAAHHGRGRPPQLTGAAGNKRKAPDVLCTARNAADDSAAVRGHTTARAELTLKALKTSFQQQVDSAFCAGQDISCMCLLAPTLAIVDSFFTELVFRREVICLLTTSVHCGTGRQPRGTNTRAECNTTSWPNSFGP